MSGYTLSEMDISPLGVHFEVPQKHSFTHLSRAVNKGKREGGEEEKTRCDCSDDRVEVEE